MNKVERVLFYDVNNKYAIVKFVDGNTIKVSENSGLLLTTEYLKNNNITNVDDYKDLIKVYNEDMEEVSSRRIIKKVSKLIEKYNIDSEIEEINFNVDEFDEEYASILFKYNIDGFYNRDKYIEEKIDIDDAFELLFSFAKENGYIDLKKLCKNGKIVSVSKKIEEKFYKELLPQLQKRYDVEVLNGESKEVKEESDDKMNMNDIKNIFYIRENGEYYVSVIYNDYEEKMLLKDARVLIEKMIKDNTLRNKFTKGFIKFMDKKDDKLTEITKEEYQNRGNKEEVKTNDNDIKNIYYVVENGNYYAVIVYNGRDEKVSLKDARLLIEDMIKSPELKSKFSNRNFLKFIEIDGKNVRELTKDEYQNTNKKKEDAFVNNSDIGKIVLYKFINENNEEITNAVIFYVDGTVKNVSKEEASRAALSFAKANNLSNEKLFELGFIEVVSGKTLEDKFSEYRNFAIKTKDEKEIENNIADDVKNIKNDSNKDADKESNTEKENDEFEEEPTEKKGILRKIADKIKEKFKKSKTVRRIALFATALLVGFGGYKLTHQSKTGTIKEQSKTDEVTEEITPQEREDFSGYSFDELLNKCTTNETRKNTMTMYRDYLTNNNETVANSYMESGKNEKLTHTVEETTAMYLAYNDIDSESIYQVYGNTSLDADVLTNELTSAIQQESLAHNIQNAPLGKDRLLTSPVAKALYSKYEQIMIGYNNADKYDTQVYYAQKFYNSVRDDLKGMSTNDYSDVESYKVIIKEFNDAFSRSNVNVDNKLTEVESGYINGIIDNVVNKKYEDIVTKQNARCVDSTIDYGDGSEVNNDINPYYNDFEESLVEGLENNNAYYVSDALRDVSVYDSYKDNVKAISEVELGKENTVSTPAVIPASTTYVAANITPTAPVQESTPVSQPETEITGEIDEPISYFISDDDDELAVLEDEEWIEEIVTEDDGVIVNDDDEIFDVIDIQPKPGPDDTTPPRPNIEDLINAEENTTEVPNEIEEYTPEQIEEVTETTIEDVIQNTPEEVPTDNTTSTPTEDNTNSDIPVVDSSTINEETTVEDVPEVNIDEDKQDSDGNLSDEYTDVSTTPDTTVSEKTNEELVNEIVEQMAQEEDTFDQEAEISITR